MTKDDKIEVSLDQAMDFIVRAAQQKDYENVIYFANTVKEHWLTRYAHLKRKFEFIANG